MNFLSDMCYVVGKLLYFLGIGSAVLAGLLNMVWLVLFIKYYWHDEKEV